MPSYVLDDPDYRRLRYLRYADDFLLGFAGPRSEAEEIKRSSIPSLKVGYTQVFTTVLTLRGWLVLGAGGIVFIFLYANLWMAARTAAPDVLWELDDQLGLPGRAVLEPLIRRVLVPAVAVIALLSGIRASASWDMLLRYLNATPFGVTDPLFGRDLAFFVFELPLWRFIYGGALTLVMGTLVLSIATYVLLRSLVLTAQGPRMAVGARNHLLGLAAFALVLRAIGFWLDRYELLYSPRGVVFGASYTDVHASLPALGALAAISLLCAAACVLQIGRGGWGFLVAGLVVLAVVWVGGLGVYPALLQRLQVTPNELEAERPYIKHNIRMTRQAYGLDGIKEQDFPAEDRLTAAALDRNSLTIKNIRLWDHRPLLTSFAQLQEIRTYYKFADVDVDRYTLNGELRQIMLSAREMSYAHLPSRVWINEHLTFTHGFGLVAGPVNRITPEGLPDLFVQDIPPAVKGGMPKITRPEIYYGELSNEYAIVRTKSQELNYPAGDQNVTVWGDAYANARAGLPFINLSTGTSNNGGPGGTPGTFAPLAPADKPETSTYSTYYGSTAYKLDTKSGYPVNEGDGLRRLAVGFRTGDHTGSSVPVTAEGPGALNFAGYLDESDLFFRMAATLSSDTNPWLVVGRIDQSTNQFCGQPQVNQY